MATKMDFRVDNLDKLIYLFKKATNQSKQLKSTINQINKVELVAHTVAYSRPRMAGHWFPDDHKDQSGFEMTTDTKKADFVRCLKCDHLVESGNFCSNCGANFLDGFPALRNPHLN